MIKLATTPVSKAGRVSARLSGHRLVISVTREHSIGLRQRDLQGEVRYFTINTQHSTEHSYSSQSTMFS
jgi:hypothetical protein